MWVILGGLLSLCDNKCKTILKGAHQWRRVISQAGDHTRSPTVVSEIPVVLSQFTSNLPGNTETFPVLHLKHCSIKYESTEGSVWGYCLVLSITTKAATLVSTLQDVCTANNKIQQYSVFYRTLYCWRIVFLQIEAVYLHTVAEMLSQCMHGSTFLEKDLGS